VDWQYTDEEIEIQSENLGLGVEYIAKARLCMLIADTMLFSEAVVCTFSKREDGLRSIHTALVRSCGLP
jgi:hypothetical protein